MRKVVFAAALGAAVLGASAAYAAGCDDKADRTAFHVRSLQTELMVAALTCGARDHYNDFAVKFKNVLVDSGRGLKRQFVSMYGSGAERQLNAYVTALANRLSQRSVAKRDSYCADAESTFAALDSMKATDLTAFSMTRPVSEIDVPSSCRPTMVVVNETK